MLDSNTTHITPAGEPLSSDEAAPFEVVNAGVMAPLLIVCDHASARIPVPYGDLGLRPFDLTQHVASDIGAASLARGMAERLRAPCVLSNFSRLLIDPNRPPGHAQSVLAHSDGVDIPGNRDVTAAQAALRAKTFFWPYHRAVSQAIERLLERDISPTLVSLHTFTPLLGCRSRPWHAAVLWNRERALAHAMLGALRREPALLIGDNEPYDGRSPLGFSMRHHGDTRALANITLEIRQDLVSTNEGAAHWAERLARAIGDVLFSRVSASTE